MLVSLMSCSFIQEVVISEFIVDIFCPTWLVLTYKTVDVLAGLKLRLKICPGEVIPVVFERRVLVVAAVEIVTRPDFNFSPFTGLLAPIWKMVIRREAFMGTIECSLGYAHTRTRKTCLVDLR